MSSSAHLTLVPALAGWSYSGLEPEVRKSFEVAVHAGSAAALALALRHELATLRRGELASILLSALPPGLAGLAFERQVERRLGHIRALGVTQVAAGLALWLADRRGGTERQQPGTLDHLAVGLGEALALVPGVSRSGAALTAARLRGLSRAAAGRLSRRTALPVVGGAVALKGWRTARGGVPRELLPAFAAGASASFAAALAAAGLVAHLDRARSYAPYGAYRVALGLATVALARRPKRT